MITSSKDYGQTWSAPRELVNGNRGGRGPVRNKVIILSNGDWIAPTSTERNLAVFCGFQKTTAAHGQKAAKYVLKISITAILKSQKAKYPYHNSHLSAAG